MGKQDVIVKQQGVISAHPSAPPAGYAMIYPKTDGKWYVIDSSGTIIEITNQSLLDDEFTNGCYVTWSGSGLTFNGTSGSYKINGSPYTSVGGSVTLDASHASLNRLDVIGYNTSGAMFKLTGTPSANPEIPQVDPATQLYRTAVFVQANATTPVQIIQTVAYNENTEFVVSVTNLTANANNTNNPFLGSKAIDITASSNGGYLQLVSNVGNLLSTSYTAFALQVRLKATLNNNSNLTITFFNGATQVSNAITLGVSYGFTKSTINTYQNVSVPISAFTFTNSTFDRFRITFVGNNFSAFYLDYIQLQGGIVSTAPLVWGAITGTLSNQTDLQAALDAKASVAVLNRANRAMKLFNYYNFS